MLFRLSVRIKGRLHGRNLVHPRPYLDQLLALGQHRAERLGAAYVARRSGLEARADVLRQAVRQAYVRVEATQEQEARLTKHLQNLEARAAELRARHGSVIAGQGLPPWAYGLAVTGLCCLELPLVYLSFLTLQLPPLHTVLLSLLCAALTGVLGHAVGAWSRHVQVGARTVLSVLLVASLAFAASLAWLRESAMQALASDTTTLDPRAAASALFGISTATLLATALLAWHQRLDPLAAELAATARKLRRATRHAKAAQRKHLRAMHRAQKATRRLDGLLASRRLHVRALGARTQALMHAYATAYAEALPDAGGLPDELTALPHLRMPEALEAGELTWRDDE